MDAVAYRLVLNRNNLELLPSECCGSARANQLDLQQIATVSETTMPQFTVAEAARAAGVDRATLYRYIKSGKLSLARDEKGKQVIDAAELTRVFPEVLQSIAPATEESVDLLQQKLRAAEEKCMLLQQQLSAATAREEWMQQQIIGLQQSLLPPPRQGIIERIAEAIARLKQPKGSA